MPPKYCLFIRTRGGPAEPSLSKAVPAAMAFSPAVAVFRCLLILLLAAALTGCASVSPPTIPLKQAAPNAAMYRIYALLPSLAKAHKDKTQLAFLADFKGLAVPVKAFNSYMSKTQGKLLAELKSWAGRHAVSLTYRRRPALFGKAQGIIADDEGGLLLHSNSADFQKRYLVMMYMDYSWQLALDKAAEKEAKAARAGPGLSRYLRNAIAVNTDSINKLWALLKNYHWRK